jgi:hypothetical protein
MVAMSIQKDKAQKQADDFNRQYSVGTRVRFWPSAKQGEGLESRTKTEAMVVSNTAVVWIQSYAACINLDNVEVVKK